MFTYFLTNEFMIIPVVWEDGASRKIFLKIIILIKIYYIIYKKYYLYTVILIIIHVIT